MFRTSAAATLLLGTVVLAGCGGGGGGGSSRSGLSLAPATSGTTAGTTSGTSTTGPTSPLPLGTWAVSGTDPLRGAYTGTASVGSAAPVYTVQRLVTFAKKLPDGRDLVQAWNATATVSSAGIRVQTQLRRADYLKRVGTATRTAADAQPLALDATFTDSKGAAPAGFAPGTQISGAFAGGPSETWTLTTAAAPLFPATIVKSQPIHALDAKVRKAYFLLYATYHQLPAVAPYVNRPEFQDAIHFMRVDASGKEFYRQLGGPKAVLVLDKVVDEIAVTEETQRANAFSRRLHEKAALFDADMKNLHVDATNFLAWALPGTKSRSLSGDAALYQGCWVGSQVYRYKVTQDPEALVNVENGVRGLCTLVDITTDKTQFARAIQDAPSAPPSWVRGSGAYANLAYLPGGNNDMLHGIDYGFVAAESVLPAGHPLRAEMAKQAASLLANVKIAQSGSHEILLRYVVARTTGDPQKQNEYESSLVGGNLKDLAWLAAGDGMIQVQSTTDWSGHHLAQVDLLAMEFLGGSSPSLRETVWRQAAKTGAQQAFSNVGACRLGLLSVIAGAAKAPGASDVGKAILEELPYPKPTGDAESDLRITSEFCMSPYPCLPWKGDWMTNPGRQQGIEGRPYFQDGTRDNSWNPAALDFSGGWSTYRAPGQDFLHAYWYARYSGQLSATD